jgi:hypothetical protein
MAHSWTLGLTLGPLDDGIGSGSKIASKPKIPPQQSSRNCLVNPPWVIPMGTEKATRQTVKWLGCCFGWSKH